VVHCLICLPRLAFAEMSPTNSVAVGTFAYTSPSALKPCGGHDGLGEGETRIFLRGFLFIAGFFTTGFFVTVGLLELFAVGFAELFALGFALTVAFVVAFAEGFALVVGFAFTVTLAVTFAEGLGVGFFVAASALDPEKASARIKKSEATRDSI
jgi:hypothetical protein